MLPSSKKTLRPAWVPLRGWTKARKQKAAIFAWGKLLFLSWGTRVGAHRDTIPWNGEVTPGVPSRWTACCRAKSLDHQADQDHSEHGLGLVAQPHGLCLLHGPAAAMSTLRGGVGRTETTYVIPRVSLAGPQLSP
jgi:hypothetical protein